MEKTDTEPLYNLGKLQEVAKANQSFIDKMVNIFIDQGPKSVKEIQEAHESKDMVKVRNVAHRMKSSINNMGITSLKNEIIEIELFDENYGSAERLDWLIC